MSCYYMVVRVKEINGKNYVYFIHYPDGKKVDVYCGAESKPESRKKALKMEIDETKRQMMKLNTRLSELTAEFKMINKTSFRAAPPE